MASTALSFFWSVLSGSGKLIGSCAHALDLLPEWRLGKQSADRRCGVIFDSSASATKYSSWRNFMGGTGFAIPVHRMHCESGWIRFLNRFATHPVELISRELGDFLTKMLLFREDDFRRRLCQDAL
jgi:hypothetical protein